MNTISAKQAQEIIDIACGDWKLKLAREWATHIVINKQVYVDDFFYKEMRASCTPEQHILFDKIFGIETKFKKGDYVVVLSDNQYFCSSDIGKVCIVRVDQKDELVLVTLKSGLNTQYKDVRKATQAEIDEYNKPVVDYSKLKTGSVVKIKDTFRVYGATGEFDFNQPVNIVLYKSKYIIGIQNYFIKINDKDVVLTTLEQNGNYLVIDFQKNKDCILEVIDY